MDVDRRSGWETAALGGTAALAEGQEHMVVEGNSARGEGSGAQ